VLGHIPDDPPPTSPDPYLIRDFLTGSHALCSLSLTSRRFRDLAQKHLFFAPVVGGYAFRLPEDSSHSRVAYLLRTLLARPDLRKHVKSLRLCFPETGDPTTKREAKEEANMSAKALSLDGEIVNPCCSLVRELDLPEDMKKSWQTNIFMGYTHATTQIFLALLPQLERLSFSENSMITISYVLSIIGMRLQSPLDAGLGSIECLPATHSLRFLKICHSIPNRMNGLDRFPNLDTLDLSIKLAGLENRYIHGLSQMYNGPEALVNFQLIRHLRLDCQIKSVGIWDFAARSGMTHILQAFPKLSSLDFYAEPSSEKNPFRSVRAFPHYQANIQTYPDASTPADYDASTEGTFWDERVYAARTEWTDYQYLVDSLHHIRPNLESLRLPGGFWTLPGATRKPLPRFDQFLRLQSLVVPQAAIISIKLYNMRFPETVHSDFELLATDVLPPKLQCLEIFDADEELLQSTWLQVLFGEQAGCRRWPELRKVEILFGPTFDDEKLGALRARRGWSQFWAEADEAGFEVLVGRDDEVPIVCF
jgi:hypothetical protein